MKLSSPKSAFNKKPFSSIAANPNMGKLSAMAAFFMNSPKKLALTIALVLAVWVIVIGDHKRSKVDAPSSEPIAANSVNSVQIRTSVAEPWSPTIVSQGQLLPWRRVTLKSEVDARVLSLLKHQGDSVSKNDELLTLTDEGRSAQLKQAQADLEYAQLELESAKTLKSSRFVSATELSRFTSALAAAEAKLEAAQLAFGYGTPKAPFDGIIDRRHIDEGDQVSRNTNLFDIVQIDKLRVTAYIPQQKVEQLILGQEVTLNLLSGKQIIGELIFISAAADEATRSYYIEVAVDNSEQLRIAGASATINLPVEPVLSHTVSPALLNLDKNGKPGMYLVDDTDTVEYFSVELLSVGNKAVVTGLPEHARIITVGAGFVKTGQTVEVSESTL